MSRDRTREDRVGTGSLAASLLAPLGRGRPCLPSLSQDLRAPGCLASSPPVPPDSRKCFACHALCDRHFQLLSAHCGPQTPQPWKGSLSSVSQMEESEVQRSNLKLRPLKQGGEEVVVWVPELGHGRTRMQTHRE